MKTFISNMKLTWKVEINVLCLQILYYFYFNILELAKVYFHITLWHVLTPTKTSALLRLYICIIIKSRSNSIVCKFLGTSVCYI